MVASSFVDVCRFTAVSAGTADFASAGPVVGYLGPAGAGMINGLQYSYRAESADLSQWEIGFGVYSSGANTLSRGTVLTGSSGAGVKINFTAAPQVAITALAEDLSFLASGTGAVSRTLQAKARDFVSVLDFGADPTGVADSTTAIQNAINSLTNAGTVYFPPGAYKTSAALVVASQGISLVGSGRISSVIRTTSATANIISVTATLVSVNNLALVGTQGQVQTAGTAISANGAHGSKFTDLFISDVFSGIQLNNSTNCLVQMVKLLDIYGPFGVSSANGGGDQIIANQIDPVFQGAYTMTSGFGAWVANTAVALNQVRSANGGFFVCTQAGTTAATGAGPVISPFGTSITDGTVKWLFATATNSVGVLLTTANSCFVAFNDVSGPWASGIQMLNSDGGIIYGNTVGQIMGTGILTGTGATNSLVQGNVVSGAYGQFSMAIEDSTINAAAGSRFLDNYINGTGWFGIFLQSVNSTASGNYIQGFGLITGSAGVGAAAGTTNFNITNNTILPGSVGATVIQVQAGASDHYNIIGNQFGTGVISDGGTGTNKIVMNQGASPALGAAVAASLLVNTPATGLGYSTGAGGAVTQATSKATGVTLNMPTGKITMSNAALATVTNVSFVLTNSVIAATDNLIVNLASGNATNATYQVWAEKIAAGSAVICVRNISAGSLSEALVLQFSVIKGAIS